MKPETRTVALLVGPALGSAAVVCILIYCRLLLLAGAVAFAAVWRATSSSTKKVPKIPYEGDPCLDSFWNEFEDTPFPEQDKPRCTATSSSTLANEDSTGTKTSAYGDSGLSSAKVPKSRFVNGSWADEPDEGGLDFLPNPVFGDEGVGRIKKTLKPQAGADANVIMSPSSEAKDAKGQVHRVNPKQVYIGGLPFKTTEEELQDFFSERCGPIEHVKLLRHADGKSRGVAFVTFINVEDARSAVKEYHDQDYEGRLLTVRITNPDQGKKDEANTNGAVKKKWPLVPNTSIVNKNNPTDGARNVRPELDKLLLSTVEDTPLQVTDFDYQAKKLLIALLRRNPDRCQECLDSVKQFTAVKDRDSVRNWRGYIYTLLSKQEPELAEELKRKNRTKTE